MIIVSNGFSKFHIATAASRAAAAGRLDRFITGAYPTPLIRRLAHLLGKTGSRKLDRLLARREAIPDDRITALWQSELYDVVARYAGDRALDAVAAGFAAYSRRAVPVVVEAAARGAKIYHFRAGFGGASVAAAKANGLITICDHSIVHPRLMRSLPAVEGRLAAAVPAQDLDSTDRLILADVEAADMVLVNSDFVRQTFRAVGHAEARIAVIYQGVDDQFLRAAEQIGRIARSGPFRMHAPAFSMRKGAPSLVRALTMLDDVDWRLTITRDIDAETYNTFADFLSDPRITVDVLERGELPKAMASHDVVVFPSYAEGSARVVFEALAAGSYVITTPNAGSVVEDGVHGRLVSPWDADALAAAIRDSVAQRPRLAVVGSTNARYIRDHFNETRYGTELLTLYDRLLAEG